MPKWVKTVAKMPEGAEPLRIGYDQVTKVECPVSETRRFPDEATGQVTEMIFRSTRLTVSAELEPERRYMLDLTQDVDTPAVTLKKGETYYAADKHTLVSESFTRTKTRIITE